MAISIKVSDLGNPQPPDTSKVDDPQYASRSSADSKVKSYHDDDVEKLQQEVDDLESNTQVNVWLTRSLQAMQGSQPHFAQGVQPRLIDSLKAYNSQHTANAAMYLDGDPANSMSVRPKVKTVVKKDISAAESSFFKNSDVVSIEAENPSDKSEVLSARMMKQLINHRFTKYIPWKHKCLGAYKQALIQGQVCAHIYWEAELMPNGQLKERPCIDIVNLENLRFDPAADPSDVVNSSPYIIKLMPTYIGDIKEKMRKGKFIEQPVSPSSLTENTPIIQERTKDKDPYTTSTQSGKSIDNQTALVMMYVMRIEGQDWMWYTLNNTSMLTDPVPLEDEYFHGKRPFVIGYTDLELSTCYPSSFVEDLIPVYEEMNIFANQSRKAIDQVLQRKWRVNPDENDMFDPRALLSDEAIVFAPAGGIEALTQPEIPESYFAVNQQMEGDFNDLAGNYNPQVPLGGKSPNDAYRTHQMLNVNAGQLVETHIANFALTFVEPVIRQMVLLEQFYETDETIIGLVGQQAGLFQKFGPRVQWSPDAAKVAGLKTGAATHQDFAKQGMQVPGAPQAPQGAQSPMGGPESPGGVPGMGGSPMGPQTHSMTPPGALPEGIDIEMLLKKELTVKVNVGLNATDPQRKKQDFKEFIEGLLELSGGNRMAINFTEVAEEYASLNGYGDGKRFLNQEIDPQLAALMQENMQLKMAIKTKQTHDQAAIAKAKITNESRERVEAHKIESREKIEAAKLDHSSAALVLEHSREMESLNTPEASNTPPPQAM